MPDYKDIFHFFPDPNPDMTPPGVDPNFVDHEQWQAIKNNLQNPHTREDINKVLWFMAEFAASELIGIGLAKTGWWIAQGLWTLVDNGGLISDGVNWSLDKWARDWYEKIGRDSTELQNVKMVNQNFDSLQWALLYNDLHPYSVANFDVATATNEEMVAYVRYLIQENDRYHDKHKEAYDKFIDVFDDYIETFKLKKVVFEVANQYSMQFWRTSEMESVLDGLYLKYIREYTAGVPDCRENFAGAIEKLGEEFLVGFKKQLENAYLSDKYKTLAGITAGEIFSNLAELRELPPLSTPIHDRERVDLSFSEEVLSKALVMNFVDPEFRVATTGVNDGVYFDHNGSGNPERTAWIRANSGFLVYDQNGNGNVDDGSELFGNHTTLADGTNADSGFEALFELDSNNDKIIDSKDAAWNRLRIWQDINNDGRVDDDELQSFDDMDIKEIKLDKRAEPHRDGNGNIHYGSIDVVDNDGVTRNITEVGFRTDVSDTEKQPTAYSFSDEIKALPNIQRMGELSALWEAMANSQSNELYTSVWAYTKVTTDKQRSDLAKDVIYQWVLASEGLAAFPAGYSEFQKWQMCAEKFFGFKYDRWWSASALQSAEAETLYKRDHRNGSNIEEEIRASFAFMTNYVMAKLDQQSWFKDLYQEAWFIGMNCMEGNAESDTFIHFEATLQEKFKKGEKAEVLQFLEGLLYSGYEWCRTLLATLVLKHQAVVGDGFKEKTRDAGNFSQLMENFSQAISYSFYGDVMGMRSWNGIDGTDMSGWWGSSRELVNLGVYRSSVYEEAGATKIIGDKIGNAILYGTSGVDIIKGTNNNNRVYGGGSSDYIFGGWGNDEIHGGDGNDTIAGEGGDDTIYGGDGDDSILGGLRVMDGQSDPGEDLWLVNVDPSLIAPSSTTTFSGDDIIYAGAGNDVIDGMDGDDYLDGGSGDDVVIGGEGDDVLMGGDGNDHLRDVSGNNWLYGGEGDDVIKGGKDNDHIKGGLGIDKIWGNGGNDIIHGGEGDDYIEGGDGTDGIYGEGGNDDIFGGIGDDTLTGGDGNDTISGGDGIDFIYGGNDNDILMGEGENDYIQGDGGVDRLYGGSGNDVLWGGSEDDYMEGGTGNDTYEWGKGDGNDTIVESGTAGEINTIKFTGLITPDQLEFTLTEGALTILHKDENKTLRVYALKELFMQGRAINRIVWPDGTEWNLRDICVKGLGLPYIGDDSDETVYGGNVDNLLFGNGGYDTLYGEGGDDYLSGNDGNDILCGGKDNDTLHGGAGNNTYIWGFGDGNDCIKYYPAELGARNTVQVYNLLPNDVNYMLRAANGAVNLVIQINLNNEELSIENVLNGPCGVSEIVFSDGSVVLMDEILQQDLMIYWGGDDEIPDITGNMQQVCWGEGAGNSRIRITDNAVEKNHVVRLLNLNPEDIELLVYYGNQYQYSDSMTAPITKNGGSLVIKIKSTGETLEVFDSIGKNNRENPHSLQGIEFADGTYWSYVEILKQPLRMSNEISAIHAPKEGINIQSNDVGATVYGSNVDDIMRSGKGNDTFYGGGGNDTYVFNRGDGTDTIIDEYKNTINGGMRWAGNDKIVFGDGIALEDLYFKRHSYDVGSVGYKTLEIGIIGTNDRILIHDGLISTGSGGIERIIVDGLELCADTIRFWDYLALMEEVGDPVGPDGTWTEEQRSAIVSLISTYWQTPQLPYLDLWGSDSADVMVGGNGNDLLYGFGGNDVMYGGKGNDYLEGMVGDDTYIFTKGNGQDTIYEEAGADRLVFAESIAITDLRFTRASADLVIKIVGTNDSITIQNWYGPEQMRVERIYASGKLLTADKINSLIQDMQSLGNPGGSGGAWTTQQLAALSAIAARYWIQTTDLANVAYGTESNDAINGGLGNDSLYGFAGDDVVHGGAGNDVLYGGSGNDVLFGDGGNDLLDGGAGNDVYVYRRGDGNDIIASGGPESGERDTIRLQGLSPNEVEYINTENGDFVIWIKNTGETLTVQGAFTQELFPIHSVEFDDGTIVRCSSIDFPNVWGTGANDSLAGNSGNEHLYGRDGNDILSGRAGDDVLEGGAGDDHLKGGTGNDVFVFGRGDGHDVVDAYDPTVGKYDMIRLRGLSEADISFSNNPNGEFIITIKDTGETLIVTDGTRNHASRIQGVEFSDGSILPFADIYFSNIWGTTKNDILAGGALDETLYGMQGNDSLNGGAGNDILHGGTGNDYLVGGTGNDVFVFERGDGNDIIDATDGVPGRRDVIRLLGIRQSEVEYSSTQFGDFVITIKDTKETITVANGIKDSLSAIQAIEFADGATVEWSDISIKDAWGTEGNDTLNGSANDDRLHGLSGDDIISGQAGNDLLEGGKGNDTLNGGVGNDVYVYGIGCGHDVIDSYDLSSGKRDIIRLIDLRREDIDFTGTQSKDLVIRIRETGETITVKNALKGREHAIQAIEFADGAVMEWEDIFIPELWGTENSDALNGRTGDDRLFGLAGNDTLLGGSGNDIFDGGTGNDHLDGGFGDDVFVFSRGDGHDTINAYQPGKKVPNFHWGVLSEIFPCRMIFPGVG